MKNGFSIKIDKLSDKYKILGFRLSETVGGKISEGEVTASFNPSNLDIDIYEIKVTISEESGDTIKFDAYVYNVTYRVDTITYKFIASTPDFINKNEVKSHKSVNGAINSCYSGNFDYSGSDIECDIHQRSETGFQLVSKLIKGLKFKSIYGFRCDELFVRELDDKTDYKMSYGEYDLGSSNLTDLKVNKSKIKDLNVVIETQSIFSFLSYSKNYIQVRSEYQELLNNYFINESFLKLLGTNLITLQLTKKLPKFKIGNLIKYEHKDNSLTSFFVHTKVITWHYVDGLNTQVTLCGYDW